MKQCKKSSLAALMFLVIGIFGVFNSLGLSLGQLSEIGPGYFPLMISSLLIFVSLIMLLKK